MVVMVVMVVVVASLYKYYCTVHSPAMSMTTRTTTRTALTSTRELASV